MKKSTTLRFTVLLGLLALIAWLPAGTAEAAYNCTVYQGGSCPYDGAIVYCLIGGVEEAYCECRATYPYGKRWFCPAM